MNQPNLLLHPIRALLGMRGVFPSDSRLWFSKYKYKPRSVEDAREEFSIALAELSEAWLLRILNELSEGQDLALNSTVTAGLQIFHIPMIDFSGISSDHISALIEVFGHEAAGEFTFFKSGRSFHAYGRSIVRPRSWYEFMGKLLLCNLPGRAPVVDQRWVGHRLVGGYSALRWSCNSSNYRQYPTFVGNMVELSPLSKREKKARLATI